MQRFAQLYAQLDATTSTNDKLAAMRSYFDDVAATSPQDTAWALYFLAGGKPRQALKTSLLKTWAQQAAGIEAWLFEECYQAVGDLAETIAHVVPGSASTDRAEQGLAAWVQRLQQLKNLDESGQAAHVKAWWAQMQALERFLLIKLIGGGFRVGVSKLLVTRALAQHAGLDAKIVAQRLMGYTDGKQLDNEVLTTKFIAICSDFIPTNSSFSSQNTIDSGQPYPFFLAHAISPEVGQDAARLQAELGDVAQWQAEWKYDGIRAQIVRRAGAVHIWSRGEELMNGRFPEIESLAAQLLDDCVLDGEVLVMKGGQPQPFHLLQQRIGRKTLTKKVLADAPVGFMAYDLLERDGQDMRSQAQSARRAALEPLIAGSGLFISPLVAAHDWHELITQRAQSRAQGVEGLMLKRVDAAYGVGRTKADGLWLKWKIDPMSVDCVLIYAQAGHGRRASVYTDYTFAVWNRTPRDAAEAQAVLDAIEQRLPAQPGALQLVAFAKAYSGLTDEEFKQVDTIIRKTTLEKFGPVRSVKPSLVFELGFEGINKSTRHKSGIAVRFPRMLRMRFDKPLHEAGTLQDLQVLLVEMPG
jgi:DNA ligase 1